MASNVISGVNEVREPDARFLMPATLVDSCVLIDVLADDPTWADWSIQKLEALGGQAPLVINPLILAEISPRFARASDLEAALGLLPLQKQALPWDAAFLAGQAFKVYRQSKGMQRSPMPDFYIGAHALLSGMRLLTRDAKRYRTYFPKLHVVCPESSPLL
jgi:predicted nucleic acid-binding protein